MPLKIKKNPLSRWSSPNGYRHVLAISLPLVASMGSITLMQFTDRMFLANYSVEAISAALPAGVASFTCIAFFLGVANYTNSFVAQYVGAGAFDRIGKALWQGIYFAIFASACLASLSFVSAPLFRFIGHPPAVQELEITYFNILTLGAGLVVLSSVLACFYSGRGLTRVVMLVHMVGALVNIPLDYCLINGVGPFPELGIKGAGLATVSAGAVIVILFCLLVFSPANRDSFGTWRNRRLESSLLKRLMRFGLPSGVQFFLEILAFTFFIQMLGRLGKLEMAASNIALSIESLSFLPMVGLHIGNATLVGQAIGKGEPEEGVYATSSALHITLVYMVLVAVVFVFFPEPLLRLFRADDVSPAEYVQILDLGSRLMRFVAVYCFFDALSLVFSGALKGAGDTRFIMLTIGGLSISVMIVPVYLAVEVFAADVSVAWSILTVYICSLGLVFWLRYRQGSWKKMRVIET
ncbi:MAG: MATE family efflux transporter [Thermodesulfobacteriota bacterium]